MNHVGRKIAMIGTMGAMLSFASGFAPVTAGVNPVAVQSVQTPSVVKQEISDFSPDEFTGITYEVNSVEDWNNLLNGVTDPEHWQTGGVYTGTESVLIKVNGNVSGGVASISTTALGITDTDSRIVIYGTSEHSTIPDITIDGTAGESNVGVNFEIRYVDGTIKVGPNVRNLTAYGSASSDNNSIDVSACFDSDNTYIGKLYDIAVGVPNIDLNLDGVSCHSVFCQEFNTVSLQKMSVGENITLGVFFPKSVNLAYTQVAGDIVLKPYFYAGFGGEITQSNVDTLIDISHCGANNVTIQGLTLENTEGSGTGINIGYTTVRNTLTIQDCNISNSETGLFYSYSSGTLVMKDTNITNVTKGIVGTPSSMKLRISDCTITGNDAEDSVGMDVQGNQNLSVDDFINQDKYDVQRCEISHFDKGIHEFAGNLYMSEVNVHDVNHGFYSKPESGSLYAKGCDFTANEAVSNGTYQGESYGVCANTTGMMLVDTNVTGFKNGVYSELATSYLFGCMIDSVDVNVDLHCAYIFDCVFKNAKLSVTESARSYVNVVNSVIEGNHQEGSVGAGRFSPYSSVQGGELCIWTLSDEEIQTRFGYNISGLSSLLNYLKENRSDRLIERSLISGYENGVYDTMSANVSLYDMDIFDCTNEGIHKDTIGQLYVEKVNVYNCKTGINVISTFFPNDVIKISDCEEYGLYSTANWGVNSYLNHSHSNDDSYIEAYDCKNGMYLSGGLSGSFHLRAHDNTNDGIQFAENSEILLSDIKSFDNGGYNIDMLGPVKSLQFTGSSKLLEEPKGSNQFTNQTETGKNMKINLASGSNPSFSNAYFYSAGELTSDNSEIFLENGSRLVFAPSVSPAEWLHGSMTFGVPDDVYSNDTIVAEVLTSHLGNDADSFVRTHFFTSKEGWIIGHSQATNGMFSGGGSYLNLEEGCEVRYDYAANGGTAWSGDFEKIAYEKGSDIDLSYTATKPGYEFIGWSLNPDDTEVVDSVTAGTKNITLYAVYRKQVTVEYHTWDTVYDTTETGYLFNKDILVYADEDGNHVYETALTKKDGEYERIGYTYDFTSAEVYGPLGTSIVGSQDEETVIALYCVYHLQGKITYKMDGKTVGSDVCEFNEVAGKVADSKFTYELIDTVSNKKGYSFVGWRDVADQLYPAGTDFETKESDVIMIADLEAIRVASLLVNPKEANLYVGDKIQLQAAVSPEDALNPDVEWISENPEIAKVGANGLVKAKSVGTVKIYAQSKENPQISDYAVIIVTEKPKENPTTTEDETTATTEDTTTAIEDDTTTEASSASTSDMTTESSTDASSEATTEHAVNGPITGDSAPVGTVGVIGGVTILAGIAGFLHGIKKKK